MRQERRASLRPGCRTLPKVSACFLPVSASMPSVLGALADVREAFRRAGMEMEERSAEWVKSEQQNGRYDK
jgi:hypothetical protein